MHQVAGRPKRGGTVKNPHPQSRVRAEGGIGRKRPNGSAANPAKKKEGVEPHPIPLRPIGDWEGMEKLGSRPKKMCNIGLIGGVHPPALKRSSH